MSQPLQEPLLKWMTQGELTNAQVFNPCLTFQPMSTYQ